MVSIFEIERFLNNYLGTSRFRDVDPVVNGIQVEGREDVSKVLTCVSITREVVEIAVRDKFDAILSHHGLLDRVTRIAGSFKLKLKRVLENDITVFAYHLPLDAHPEIGSSVSIARMLGLTKIEWIPEEKHPPIGVIGYLERDMHINEVHELAKKTISSSSVLLRYGSDVVRRIAVVPGAGARYIRRFRGGEIDLFVTGEFREDCEVYAADEGINVLILGHYASEIPGVVNLTRLVRDRFEVEAIFVKTKQIV